MTFKDNYFSLCTAKGQYSHIITGLQIKKIIEIKVYSKPHDKSPYKPGLRYSFGSLTGKWKIQTFLSPDKFKTIRLKGTTRFTDSSPLLPQAGMSSNPLDKITTRPLKNVFRLDDSSCNFRNAESLTPCHRDMNFGRFFFFFFINCNTA